jgi:hypothetical protein
VVVANKLFMADDCVEKRARGKHVCKSCSAIETFGGVLGFVSM